MTTVSEVLDQLNKEGYTVDFNLRDDCLMGPGDAIQLYPDDFQVDRHYRFEGPSAPGDGAVVYAISSLQYGVKGTLVNGYGISSEALNTEMVKALQKHPIFYASPEETAGPLEKSNEATPQRPAGTRPLNAPLLVLDLPQAQAQIKQESAWHRSDRNALTLLQADGLRLVLIALHAGAEMKTHAAPGIISVQVLEGHLGFQAEGQTVELKPGQLLTLQANLPYSVAARQESVFLLTMANPAAK
ncbi:cupin domain-containing protein [Hymenobacter caeli]|uniref:Quercetin dioxygenase-like cupin family protein n=1 Tax=Hymenobacter caeli TaxID=2735894 RepID=A0ABX2FUV9_9BACT|nr:cupin domain-containing protein [Hymenobacter caeli]NRT20982.1 quercetin dioxygenase-like cupin family protein [Hymenobacter caeli]